jgi:hypothetical protein
MINTEKPAPKYTCVCTTHSKPPSFAHLHTHTHTHTYLQRPCSPRRAPSSSPHWHRSACPHPAAYPDISLLRPPRKCRFWSCLAPLSPQWLAPCSWCCSYLFVYVCVCVCVCVWMSERVSVYKFKKRMTKKARRQPLAEREWRWHLCVCVCLCVCVYVCMSIFM